MRHDSQRAAWTRFVESGGTLTDAPANKYHVACKEDRHGYASRYEAECAAKLQLLESRGQIRALKEQVSFTLVDGDGKIRTIRYVADFVWTEPDGTRVTADAKGCKTPIYRLKRKMMKLLLGLEIREL